MYPNAAVSAKWLPQTAVGKNRFNGCKTECLRIAGCPVVSNQFLTAGSKPDKPLPPELLHGARWFIHEYLFETDGLFPDPDVPSAAVVAAFPRPPRVPKKNSLIVNRAAVA